jgi:hypothetical protein
VAFTQLKPRFTLQPASQNVEEGQRATFTAASEGGLPPHFYQWRFNGTNLVNGPGISGATTLTLTISNAQPAQAGNYSIEVSTPEVSSISSNALLTVTPLVPLSIALDTANLVWITNGTPAWVGQQAVSHDGSDAARSGAIGNNGSNSFQTTVTGPGTLTFWWKISSETNNDRLMFFTNNVENARISGEVDWRVRAVNVGPGTHTLRWTYAKNGSGAAGSDRAWVDEVRFGILPPVIVTQPSSVITDTGENASFTVNAASSTSISYQWFFKGAPVVNGGGISGANAATLSISGVQSNLLGAYWVVVSNSAGAATSAVATLNFTPTLAEALDALQLTFTTGGTGLPWSGRLSVTHDGQDAAESGDVNDSTYTWIKTTVTGPGVLRFWWKTSSEEDHDWLRLMMDTQDQMRISGELDWEQVTFNVPTGSHEIQWRYSKNSSLSAGLDQAWVDQVSYAPDSAPAPIPQAPLIEIQPVSYDADENEAVDLNVAALGSSPLRYRWYFNGNPIADGGNIGGATTPALTIMNALRSQAGSYWVVITNSFGGVTSRVAHVTVTPLLSLAESLDMLDFPFTTDGEAFWEGHPVVTHDGFDAARSGTVGDDQSTSMQTILTGPGMLSFWWKVSSETNADVLVFSVNDFPEAFISGETDWEQRFISLSAGEQYLEWTYLKNSMNREGNDRAWVDQLTFLADGAPVPAPRQASSAASPGIAVNANTVRLTWNASVRATYRVEYKENLADKEWTALESEVLSLSNAGAAVPGENYTATIEDVLTPRTRYYRVLEFRADE